MAIFINQAIDGAVSIAGQPASIATNGQTFTVGSDSPSGSNYLNGKVDQLQVFSAVVSDAAGQEIFGNRHAMQLLGCMETGSGFNRDTLYYVNSENSLILEVVEKALAQTLTNKTLVSPVITGVVGTSGTTINGFALGGDVAAGLKQIVDAVLVNAVHYNYSRIFHHQFNIAGLTTGFVGTGTVSDSQGLISLGGSTTNDVAKYEYGDSLVNKPMSRDRKFEYHCYSICSTAVTSLELEFGIFDSAVENAVQSTTSHHAVIYYDSSESGNWICANGNASAQTKTTTSVAVVQNTPYLFAIINDETDVKFYINGNLVATHTTNLPNASTTLFPRGYLKCRSTPSRTAYSKFWYWVDRA
jgi:hypothetical protein